MPYRILLMVSPCRSWCSVDASFIRHPRLSSQPPGLVDFFQNPVILFGPVLRHHAGGGLRAPRPPSRWWARQLFLRTDHPHLNLDLLAINDTEVFVEFDGLAVDF